VKVKEEASNRDKEEVAVDLEDNKDARDANRDANRDAKDLEANTANKDVNKDANKDARDLEANTANKVANRDVVDLEKNTDRDANRDNAAEVARVEIMSMNKKEDTVLEVKEEEES